MLLFYERQTEWTASELVYVWTHEGSFSPAMPSSQIIPTVRHKDRQRSRLKHPGGEDGFG